GDGLGRGIGFQPVTARHRLEAYATDQPRRAETSLAPSRSPCYIVRTTRFARARRHPMRRCFLVLTTLCAVALSADGRDAKWINQRIQRIKQSDSTAWKSIPWAASLSEARELSQKEQRPVFLFTHDGNL